MKGIIKDSLILFAITLVAGFLLGWVYDITKEPIAYQKELAKQNACKAVFQNAETFEPMDMTALADKMAFDGGSVDEVLSAKDASGKELGYVLTVTSNEGYGGKITFMLGIQNNGTINGISFTSISETAGLGMKAKNPEFMNQFSNKNVESFVYTKTGATKDNEIDAISAATVTTNAVTNGVNGGVAFFYENLKVAGGAANE